MNFIHRGHLLRAARTFREERRMAYPWNHCYPYFPVLAATVIQNALASGARIDAGLAQEMAAVWRLIRESVNNSTLQNNLDLMRTVSD